MKTFFRQPCPICGRPLNVPIELLGSEAWCVHCSGVFTANGDETKQRQGSDGFCGSRQSAESNRGSDIDFQLNRYSPTDLIPKVRRRKEFA
jgi:hypothetical protein